MTGALALLLPLPAEAHIKWFAPFDVPSQPRPLSEVLSTPFIGLLVVSLAILVAVCLAERTNVGVTLLQSVERLTAGLRSRTEAMYRVCTGTFFIALWTLGTVILTPELKTQLGVLPWLQLSIAAGMLWRPTMLYSAAGIVALYVYGVFTYGIFHLLDYPIFLGLAAYLGTTSLGWKPFGLRPLDIVRWAAAITLMWASYEKWAYPQWTYPLLAANPSLCLGFSSPFYMQAAGYIEFGLGFGLIWTPLVRRSSAVVLASMFIGAVFDFGKIDAIGHLMIIVVLLGVAADDEPIFRRPPLLAPVWYVIALAGFGSAYYGLHALIFGTKIW